MLHLLLVVAAGLFAIGLYGTLSQQSVVMLMMGLELMVNAVLLAAVTLWRYCWPDRADAQVLVLVAFTVMAVEMAMGFAATTAIFRARDVDTTDDATDLRG